MTEQKPDPGDDQRGRGNLGALVAVLVVLIIGIWLAVYLAKNLQEQKCEMERRMNCTNLPQPSDQ